MRIVPLLELRGQDMGEALSQAKALVAKGAPKLFVVDVSAALGETDNAAIVAEICKTLEVPVAVGGGTRTVDKAQQRFDAGASEIVLGSMLVDDERSTRAIIAKFPERVIAGVDARGSQVVTHGWLDHTPVDRDALIKRVALWGIKRVLYTDVRAEENGFDFNALRDVAAVASAAEVFVTAKGLQTIDELRTLQTQAPPAVDACVVTADLYALIQTRA
jgi:phosphoribosylformimino-5-aminoimidazole carboxamide ribotide isomerase